MPDVIVVDDDRRAASSFVDIIRYGTKLEAVWTDDPSEALELVKQFEISVAVLDQQMPQMTGTQLFKSMREHSPDIQGIMFSGRSERDDYRDAIATDIDAFLDKDDVDDLPELVRKHYLIYKARLASRPYTNPQIVSEYRSGFSFRGSKVTVTLLAIDSADRAADIWLDDLFNNVVTLHSGQTKSAEKKATEESQVLFENELQSKAGTEFQVGSKASFSLPMKGGISTQARRTVEQSIRHRVQQTQTQKIEDTATVSYTLDPNQLTADGKSVRIREIEESPIYERKRATLKIDCDCCGIERYESVVVLVFTGRWKTRYVEHAADGSKQVTTMD